MKPNTSPRSETGWGQGHTAALSIVLVFVVVTILAMPGLVGSGVTPSLLNSRVGLESEQPANEFYLNFTESGLHPATQWSITLNGGSPQSGMGVVISFLEPNNTYTFSVGGATGYNPAPGGGSIIVNGADVNQTITFTPIMYTLTVTESNLPFGTNWTADVGGSPKSEAAPSSIQFSLTEGGYPFSISSADSSYVPSPATGTVNINGANQNLPITFTRTVFQAKFIENGLPTSTMWTVIVSGQSPVSSTTTSLVIPDLADGSYTYTVSSANASLSAPPGSFDITGNNATIQVSFTSYTYSVTFTQTGLKGVLYWNVSLDGVNQESGTGVSGPSDIIFNNIPNGTYPYTVGAIPGWSASLYSGNITVNGNSPGKLISWTQVGYQMTYNETGLSPHLGWWVNITGGHVKPSNNTAFVSSIGVPLPNGTYQYRVASDDKTFVPNPSSEGGSFTVNGASQLFLLTFLSVNYTVTFNESNLPGGILWWANISRGGPDLNSTGTSIVFSLQNGTYNYTIAALSTSWGAIPGGFIVQGRSLSVNIDFINQLYLVNFNETGLDSGTSWTVTAFGQPNSSIAPGYNRFMLPLGGMGNWSVTPVPGFTTNNPNGSLTIHKTSTYLTIVFRSIGYPIRFNETGLPKGALWFVNITYSNLTSFGSFNFTTASGPVPMPNGTYGYSVASADKLFTPEITSNTLTVNGLAFNVSVVFLNSTYALTFVETGLPSGSLWSVVLTIPYLLRNGTIGSLPVQENSSTSTILFRVGNGTYPYRVPLYGVYSPSPVSGNQTISGSNVTISVTFVRALYTLTFTETGLAGGTTWTVILDGLTEQSTNASIIFSVGNGTFPYVVQPPGGSAASPASGWVRIAGSSTTTPVSFSSSSGGGSGGLTTTQLVVLVGLVAAGAIVILALVISRRRSAPPRVPPPGASAAEEVAPPPATTGPVSEAEGPPS